MISKNILWFLGKCSSKIFPYKYQLYWSRLKQYFYTAWISQSFKSFGKGSIIRPSALRINGPEYISIGSNTYIDSNVHLNATSSFQHYDYKPEIIIGDNCEIGEGAHISCISSIKIGNNCLMGKMILITDNAHGLSEKEHLDMPPNSRPLFSKGAIIIEENVWIGEKSSIMPGVHIGKGVIIAANSVVTHNIPSYTVAAGVPAKVIKDLN